MPLCETLIAADITNVAIPQGAVTGEAGRPLGQRQAAKPTKGRWLSSASWV